MEILWLVLVWVLLLYFVKLHRELSFYKRLFFQHKDIYVPTLPEMLETSTPGRQIISSVLDVMRYSLSNIIQKWNSVFKKNEDSDIPIIIMQPGHEKELKF